MPEHPLTQEDSELLRDLRRIADYRVEGRRGQEDIQTVGRAADRLEELLQRERGGPLPQDLFVPMGDGGITVRVCRHGCLMPSEGPPAPEAEETRERLQGTLSDLRRQLELTSEDLGRALRFLERAERLLEKLRG